MCYVHVRVHVHVRVRVRVRVRVQHLCELRASEGRVPRAAVERTDAFLQAEQALVNLRPLEARRAVLGRGPAPPLVIHEEQLEPPATARLNFRLRELNSPG